MRYKPTNTVNGVVVSRLQGEPTAEIMLVTDDGKSQVLTLPILLLGRLVEQGAMALARAATELPIPPRKQCEPPATASERNVMQEVSKFVRDYDNGGASCENTTLRNQEYADVANRTQAALDSVAWNRRSAPHLKTS